MRVLEHGGRRLQKRLIFHFMEISRGLRRKKDENPLPSQLKGQPAERIARVADANSEFGNRMLNLATEQMAKLAQEMLGMKREE